MNIEDVIKDINAGKNIFDVGKIVNISDFVVEVIGLDKAFYYEKINLADKAIGYVTEIKPESCMIAILKKNEELVIGDEAMRTNEIFQGYFSSQALGRMINILGEDPLLGKTYEKLVKVPIEEANISIMDRGTVNEQLHTGITGIDLMYPIGLGQRQLIIGDKKTGKTQLCLDTIVNQKDKNVLCIYVAIGKTKKEVKDIYYELTKRGAASYTIIIASFHDELPTRTYLTPYVALSIAESFMLQTYDVLVCLDDLKKHADIYRQISLASKKTPGRDAYPSDIFYTHSRLLEKGCQHKNGGSITILPIVETKAGDITDYISTNIISICDGQIVLSAKNFAKGEKPAIDYGLSVSRLGGNVQDSEMKRVGSKVRIDLLSYLDVRQIYELANIDEMSEDLQRRLKEGKIILDNLRQYKFSPKTKREMIDSYKFLMENKQ